MSLKNPYPDHAYLERDPETNEKRWYSSKGMGVEYVHEDRVAEKIEASVNAEREACAAIVEKLAGADVIYPAGLQLILDSIRNRT